MDDGWGTYPLHQACPSKPILPLACGHTMLYSLASSCLVYNRPVFHGKCKGSIGSATQPGLASVIVYLLYLGTTPVAADSELVGVGPCKHRPLPTFPMKIYVGL